MVLLGVGLFPYALSQNAVAAPNFGQCDLSWSNCLVFGASDSNNPDDALMTEFFTNPQDQIKAPGAEAVDGKVILRNGTNEVIVTNAVDESNFVIGIVNEAGNNATAFARPLTVGAGVTMVTTPPVTATYKLYHPGRDAGGGPGSFATCDTHTQVTQKTIFRDTTHAAVFQSVSDVVTGTTLITMGCPRSR